MEFSTKYSSTTENDDKKIIIGDDAYAIGEMIQALIDKLEQTSRREL
jgi:hypothetical protein